MFRLRPDGPPAAIEVTVEGRPVLAPQGASAAAAVLLAGLRYIRETPAGGARRGPYCLIGVCFECLAEIDGVPNCQSCMIAVRPGMQIRRQLRARAVDAAAPSPSPSPEDGIGGAANRQVDLAIVGAGPAGMAAAVEAAGLGLGALLIDEHPAPGGQIWRGVERAGPGSPLAADYGEGRALVAALRDSGARHLPATTVWHIDPDGTLFLLRDGSTRVVAARQILLATGAIERPVPILGWTLPGVMSVGGAQILLKSADLVPEGRVVLAGQGPLLWLLAAQLARAGAPPSALLETKPYGNWLAALRAAGGLWPGRRLLWQGLRLMREVRRAGIPVRRGVRGLRAVGDGVLEQVEWQDGRLAADHLLLHEGVIPNVQISLALQLRHQWDAAQSCWRPATDAWGRSSLAKIHIAGDGAGIAGAAAAALGGRLAALDVGAELGRIDAAERDRRARPLRQALAHDRALRPFLDGLYQPPAAVLAPDDDAVIACRCEEVTVGQIRAAARLGAVGPNQLKAFTRCGMGPCQGRLCGPTVAAVIADTLHRPVAEIGAWRPRAPYKPVTLGALADLEPAPSGTEAQHREGK